MFFVAASRGGWSESLHRQIEDFPEFLRSDNDGLTWRLLSSFTEGDWSQPNSALAEDSSDPEPVYSDLGLAGSATGAKTSPDGGATWAKLGRKDIGPVSDIWVSTPRTCTLRAIRGCGASSII
jgi:hypothetical protein